jgi:hypothetical protein
MGLRDGRQATTGHFEKRVVNLHGLCQNAPFEW